MDILTKEQWYLDDVYKDKKIANILQDLFKNPAKQTLNYDDISQ